jgi:hypothetical protein
MKIGLLPHKGAKEHNNAGLGDVRASSNIYHFLQREGYDVTYRTHVDAQDIDVYFDVNTHQVCEQVTSVRHIHNSFYSQNIERHGGNRRCANGELTTYGTFYRKTYQEDLQHPADLTAVFTPTPFLKEWRPEIQSPAFERTEITWAIRRCSANREQHEYADCLLRALLRLNQGVDFTLNVIDSDEMADFLPLIQQFKNPVLFGRIPWPQVLEIQARTKLNMYHNDLSGASTNEAMLCGAVPVLPADNLFWYVPDGVGSPKTEPALYETLHQLWFDPVLFGKHWSHYQEVISDHQYPKVAESWKAAIGQK